MNKFKDWMDTSTTYEKIRVATEANTSAGLLYQLASGERSPSAKLAGDLEVAFKKLYPKLGITRGDLNDACARCPYFKNCKSKGKKK